MSQSSSEKFMHFSVDLLKDSFTLEALREDAVKHHMVEHPGQLIALRLTEYYEMMTKGIVQPVIRVPAIMMQAETGERADGEKALPSAPPSALSQLAGKGERASHLTSEMSALPRDAEPVIFASPAAERNADEAADYWTAL